MVFVLALITVANLVPYHLFVIIERSLPKYKDIFSLKMAGNVRG